MSVYNTDELDYACIELLEYFLLLKKWSIVKDYKKMKHYLINNMRV